MVRVNHFSKNRAHCCICFYSFYSLLYTCLHSLIPISDRLYSPFYMVLQVLQSVFYMFIQSDCCVDRCLRSCCWTRTGVSMPACGCGSLVAPSFSSSFIVTVQWALANEPTLLETLSGSSLTWSVFHFIHPFENLKIKKYCLILG